ncbi:CBN-ELB-1 protein [Caenorhabditis brenneri]|uniref:CBN-ELB-1 protein n=1 Tax=Caenorhabditis brenneri TaxID=135651 RepID=G0PAB0_CAEBE|nr:CBN-ELB-1 protein [Caenorhabditis brenneri]
MAQELFFEVRRQKSHIYLDAEENQTVMDLKQMVAGITHDAVGSLELWKLDEDGRKSAILHDTATLVECGFSSTNAKAQSPAALGLRVTNSDESLEILCVSTPPPIPDAMRQEQVTQD